MSDVDLDGRVAVVTGAGAGLGRAEATALAKAGASVVLNDLPGAADGTADELTAAGSKVTVVAGDVGESGTAEAMLKAALDLGGLDIVVNNAGITRDKMLFNMTDDEWDLVMKVHLRGHFLLSRNAAAYWRGQAKESGQPVYGRVVNTSSEAGLVGPPGQANYGAAKAGITALTLSTARALGRIGVTANAICPRARTAMTADVFGADESGKSVDPYSADHVAPLVAYLASPAAARISGQVFIVYGGQVSLMRRPSVEQTFRASGDLWDAAGLHSSLGAHFADRDPNLNFGADLAL